MVLENSFEAPKDFKQVRNVKYQQSRKYTKNKIGHKNNLADEVLHCISMVDSHEFVQHCSKTKDRMPNFICYTENQRQDLIFFCPKKVITQLELTERSIWAVFLLRLWFTKI